MVLLAFVWTFPGYPTHRFSIPATQYLIVFLMEQRHCASIRVCVCVYVCVRVYACTRVSLTHTDLMKEGTGRTGSVLGLYFPPSYLYIAQYIASSGCIPTLFLVNLRTCLSLETLSNSIVQGWEVTCLLNHVLCKLRVFGEVPWGQLCLDLLMGFIILWPL